MSWFWKTKDKKKNKEKEAQTSEKSSNKISETTVKKNVANEAKVQKSKNTQSDTEQNKKALYRVVYDKKSKLWLIKRDGAKRVIATFSTKESALVRVKELSQSNNLSYIVHKKDGKFQKK